MAPFHRYDKLPLGFNIYTLQNTYSRRLLWHLGKSMGARIENETAMMTHGCALSLLTAQGILVPYRWCGVMSAIGKPNKP